MRPRQCFHCAGGRWDPVAEQKAMFEGLRPDNAFFGRFRHSSGGRRIPCAQLSRSSGGKNASVGHIARRSLGCRAVCPGTKRNAVVQRDSGGVFESCACSSSSGCWRFCIEGLCNTWVDWDRPGVRCWAVWKRDAREFLQQREFCAGFSDAALLAVPLWQSFCMGFIHLSDRKPPLGGAAVRMRPQTSAGEWALVDV